MELQQKALLVTLSLSAWDGRRFDKAVTAEVAAIHQTSVDAGRYNK